MSGKGTVNTNWMFKGCPRCAGDLHDEKQYREWVCLQCGYFKPYGPDPAQIEEERKERRRRA